LFALYPALPALPAFATAPAPNQLPTGGAVTGGQASIEAANAVMNVNQSSQKAIINWSRFDVGSQAQVNFNQPNASSQTLNRVVSADASQIYGKITANGQIFLINPNGVVIGQGAQMTASGVVASTLDITDQNFSNGAYKFEGNGATGSITNAGTITTPSSGHVALLGVNVENHGTITTGNATLAAGGKIEIPLTETGLISIEASTTDASIANSGTIKASQVHVEAQSSRTSQILHTGRIKASAVTLKSSGAVKAKGSSLIDASTAKGKGGTVKLLGKTVEVQDNAQIRANGPEGGGVLNIGGPQAGDGDMQKADRTEIGEATRIEANATENGDGGTIIIWSNEVTKVGGLLFAKGGTEGGNGGFIETSSAGSVDIASTAKVNTLAPLGSTGLWLLDPTHYTIAASGGNETGASVTASLATSNRIISTIGSVYVNDDISWSANTLTLKALAGDVDINAIMTATGTAGLVMTATGNINVGLTSSGFSGKVNLATGTSLSINSIVYTIINSLGAAGSTTATDLQGINGNRAGAYALGSDIDATATSGWNSGAGFTAIGGAATQFTGKFNGLGHSISNIFINQSATNYIGLFGYASAAATISNVALLSASITAYNVVGGLAGVNLGTIRNVYTTGSLSANYKGGGVVGENQGTVTGSISSIVAGGGSDIGGFAGYNTGTISSSSALGTATTTGDGAGGFVGENLGTITDSAASGNVSGTSAVGGLTGANSGTITSSSATGGVTGTGIYVGGLAGVNNAAGSISDSYATGNVITDKSGLDSYVGGLVGRNFGAISSSHAEGTVEGNANNVGGLVGTNSSGGSITGTYATGAVTGHALYVGGLVGGASEGSAITSSYATGNVTSSSSYVGGLVGSSYITISSSYATGTISGVNHIGGLVGYSVTGAVANSHASGNVSGASYVGGLVGTNVNASSIAGSYATGSVTATAAYSGGLAGVNDTGSTIDTSYATGNVQGGVTGVDSWAGGLVGRNYNGNISNSYATGNVNASGNAVGGFTGRNGENCIILNSYATGNVVSSGNGIGGFVGQNDPSGDIRRSYATGTVNSGTGSYIGGFVGYNLSATISDSYALGSVTGSSEVGGFAGRNSGSVSSSYSVGAVIGTTNLGGFLGYSAGGTTTNSYWNTTTSNRSTSAGGTGLTSAQMKVQSNYSSWDFASTWSIVAGISYPYLQWQGTPGIITATGNLGSTKAIQVVVNGAIVGAGTTGYDGSLYAILPQGTFSAGSNLLLFNIAGGATAANAVYIAGSNVASGLVLNSSTLWAGSGNGVLNTSALITAKGSLASADIQYTVSGSDITLATTTSLTNTSTGGITINTGINWSANTLTINPTTGDININAIMNATGTAGLVMTATGSIDTALSAGGFTGKVNLASGTSLTINSHAYTIINSLGAEGSTTGTDLQGMSGNLTRYYALGSDIDASATSGWASGFLPVGTEPSRFRGVFQGLGHTVSDLYISRATIDYVGLFGFSDSTSSFSNLGLTGVNITGQSYVGALVGEKYGGPIRNTYVTGNVYGVDRVGGMVGYNYYGTMTNSFTTTAVDATGSNIGGLIGYTIGGPLSNVYTTGTVSGYEYIGGVTGYSSSSTIQDSYATGAIDGTASVGGLVGYNSSGSTVSNSHATGTISGDTSVGGLVARNYGIVTGSYATGYVDGTGGSYIGGLVGAVGTGGQVHGSYATGNVTGNINVGGLAGYNYAGTITTSYATGSVSGTTQVGGFVGESYNNSTIENSWSTGSVLATSDYVGGFAGMNYSSTITESWASGNVIGRGYVGGLVGYNRGASVYRSYATGKVTATGSNVGGLVGWSYNGALVENSYATGSVSGINSVGGLIGSNDSADSIVRTSYSTGVVVGTIQGGFAGKNLGTITNSYWNTTTSGLATSAGGTGLTTAQMKAQANFSDWNFSTVWDIIEGTSYPYLQVQGTPSVITGTSNLGSAQLIQVVVNGVLAGSGTTGSDGSLYLILRDGGFSVGDDILLYNIGGGASAANAVYLAGSNVASGISLTSSTLWANSANGVLKTSDLVTAKGSVSSADINYTVSGSEITLGANTSLTNTSTGGITIDNVVNWSANTLTINPSTGNININAVMNATGTAHLVMTTTGTVKTALTDSGFTGKVNLAAGTALTINGHAYTIIRTLGAEGSTTTTDLQGMSGDMYDYYALGSDIDASETATWNSGAGFLNVSFRSIFDGLGHTISNLYLNRPASDYQALFGFTWTSTIIRNVGLISPTSTGKNYTGSLAGRNYGTVLNSYALNATVTGTGTWTGGLVAYNYGDASVTSESWAVATVSGPSYVGGLMGLNDNLVSDSHASGTATASSELVGGLVAYNGGATIDDSYASTDVYGPQYAGGLTGRNFGTIRDSHASGTVAATGWFIGGLSGTTSYRVINSYATGEVRSTGASVGGLIGFAYAGDITGSYATGAVYGVDDTGGLVGLSNGSNYIADSYATGNVTSTGVNVGGLVGRHIDHSETVNSYATGTVRGTSYLGGLVGYHRDADISGSHATGDVIGSAGNVGGLTGYIYTSTTTSSTTVADSYATGSVRGTSGVGGLVGSNSGSTSSITNSYATGAVTGTAGSTGGLVGGNSGTIEDSHATGSVQGTTSVGGLTGTNSKTITNSYATGTVRGTTYIGGLSGESSSAGTITNSYATGAVTATSNYVGGLVGRNYGAISYSYAEGVVTGANVSGNGYAGGLVGYNAGGDIMFAHAIGSVTSTGVCAGGLVGISDTSGTIEDSYATGNVSGTANVGGLVGQNTSATISRTYATGSATGSGNIVGGLVGQHNGATATITDSHATGAVTGKSNTGGFVGYTYTSSTISTSYATGTVSGTTNVGGFIGSDTGGLISVSYATGNVTGSSSYVGGFVGLNGGSAISNSYALGNATGTGYVGGFAGANNVSGVITNSYSIGIPTGGGAVGGFVGSNGGTSTAPNSYWDETTSGVTFSEAGTGLTTAQMKAYLTFSPNWSISQSGTTTPSGSTIWVIYDTQTYPMLKNFMTGLTITANSVTRTYDATAYAGGPAGVTYAPESYNASNVLGTLSYTGAYDGATNAGSYAITPTGLYSVQLGYDITFVSGALTINPAALTVSAGNQSKTYGTTGSLGSTSFSVTSGTLYGSDSIAGVTLASAGADATATVSSYAIAASNATGSGVSNYTITYVDGSLSITPAALTITANNRSKTYGNSLPLGTAEFEAEGLANDDAVSSITLQSAGTGTNATVGSYVITTSNAVGSGLSNYTISYVDGNLAVTPAALTITADNQTKRFGTILTLGTSAFTATGLRNSDSISGATLASDGAGPSGAVGAHAIAASNALGSGLGNYTIAYVDGVLTVTAAPSNSIGPLVSSLSRVPTFLGVGADRFVCASCASEGIVIAGSPAPQSLPVDPVVLSIPSFSMEWCAN
jgi:filamentous hemagglutinin family protein